MIRFIAFACGLACLSLLVAGCSSSRELTLENHESVSQSMAASLVHQLEERSDLRHLHVTVKEFEDHTGAARTRVHRGKVYFAKTETPREFRTELIEALSPRVAVVDGTSGYAHATPTRLENGMRTAVLVGEYTADEKRTVYVRTRVIDLENKVVLATAEGVVRK